MTEEKLICGQCEREITESYISKGEWNQCFDCYHDEYEYMYNDDYTTDED